MNFAFIWRCKHQQLQPAAGTMKEKVHHIRKRFPTMHQHIDRLSKKDPEFLSLCEDYRACVNALRHWTESGEPEAQARVAEYRTIIGELEDEIKQILEKTQPHKLD
jgi:uncharacterized protein YdcH (DUF465 family)